MGRWEGRLRWLRHLVAMLGEAEVDGGFDENLNGGEAAFEGKLLPGS